MIEYELTISGVVFTGPHADEMKRRLTEHLLRFQDESVFKIDTLNVNLIPTGNEEEEVGYGTPS